MYRQTPKFGYCPGPDQTVLRALKEDDFIDIEMVLRFFHQEVKSYLDTLSAFHRVQFLGNVDSAVVDALFSTQEIKPSHRAARKDQGLLEADIASAQSIMEAVERVTVARILSHR